MHMTETVNARILVLVKPSEKARFQEMARDDGRSLSDWCRRNLIRVADAVQATKETTPPTVRGVAKG